MSVNYDVGEIYERSVHTLEPHCGTPSLTKTLSKTIASNRLQRKRLYQDFGVDSRTRRDRQQ